MPPGPVLQSHHSIARFSRPLDRRSPVERIVSLLPSATEIVAALGLLDRLVAVTHECDHPPEVAPLPRITANRIRRSEESRPRSAGIDAAVRSALADGHGLYHLDEVLLRELQPDLVLTQELCAVCAVAYPMVVEAARMAGDDDGPLVVSLEPRRLADMLRTVALVADLCDVPHTGAWLVADLERRLADAGSAAAARYAREGVPRVAMIEWLDPLFAPGHWVPDQVAAAGGVSVLGSRGDASRELSWDRVEAANPDIVVLGLCGFDLSDTLAEWSAFDPPQALRNTPAWQRGEIWAIDGSAYVSRPGPRLVDGVEIIAGILRHESDARAVQVAPVAGTTAHAQPGRTSAPSGREPSSN